MAKPRLELPQVHSSRLCQCWVLASKWYPLHSGRLAVDGSFQGMSFFGYGNIMTAPRHGRPVVKSPLGD